MRSIAALVRRERRFSSSWVPADCAALPQAPGGQPFGVVSLDDIADKVATWRRELPMIEPHYAVKCNNDSQVLDLLASLGCAAPPMAPRRPALMKTWCRTGFDCASEAEIASMVRRGVSPDSIIFAHPCKPVAHLEVGRAIAQCRAHRRC